MQKKYKRYTNQKKNKMPSELKTIEKDMDEIKEKLGINAFERIKHYCFTLYRKIEDLIESRDNWKKKYYEIKKKTQ